MRSLALLLSLCVSFALGCTSAPATIDRSTELTRFVDVPVPPGYVLDGVSADEEVITYRCVATEDPDVPTLVAFFEEALPKEGWQEVEYDGGRRVLAKKKGSSLVVSVVSEVGEGSSEAARLLVDVDARARRTLSILRVKR